LRKAGDTGEGRSAEGAGATSARGPAGRAAGAGAGDGQDEARENGGVDGTGGQVIGRAEKLCGCAVYSEKRSRHAGNGIEAGTDEDARYCREDEASRAGPRV